MVTTTQSLIVNALMMMIQGADGRLEGASTAAGIPALCARLQIGGILMTDIGQLSLGYANPTLLDLSGNCFRTFLALQTLHVSSFDNC